MIFQVTEPGIYLFDNFFETYLGCLSECDKVNIGFKTVTKFKFSSSL